MMIRGPAPCRAGTGYRLQDCRWADDCRRLATVWTATVPTGRDDYTLPPLDWTCSGCAPVGSALVSAAGARLATERGSGSFRARLLHVTSCGSCGSPWDSGHPCRCQVGPEAMPAWVARLRTLYAAGWRVPRPTERRPCPCGAVGQGPSSRGLCVRHYAETRGETCEVCGAPGVVARGRCMACAAGRGWQGQRCACGRRAYRAQVCYLCRAERLGRRCGCGAWASHGGGTQCQRCYRRTERARE